MPPDPAIVAETRPWLVKARRDLEGAEALLAASKPDLAVFHCQQAAEKALKGFLSWHQILFAKTHSLEEIGEQCLAVDSSLKELIDRAVPLTEYASAFRYPGEPEQPSEAEAGQALALAREVLEAICARLPEECRPQ